MHHGYRLFTLAFLAVGLLMPLTTKTNPEIKWPANVSKKGYLVGAVVGLALYIYANLKYKKTQPKRVYPQDDSWQEILKFVHDELLVGQIQLPERESGSRLDPEDPTHVITEYSKVEARGLGGKTEYYMTKVIIPTIILAAAFKTVKGDILKTLNDGFGWMSEPEKLFDITQATGK